MKTFKKITSLIFICIFAYSTAYAQSIIYVSTTGNDDTGDGTVENPYETPQYALYQTSDNDTVVLRGGTYPSEEIRI